jgi:hypothetical protein
MLLEIGQRPEALRRRTDSEVSERRLPPRQKNWSLVVGDVEWKVVKHNDWIRRGLSRTEFEHRKCENSKASENRVK